MKKILFVTSEAVPYIKTGGLADVTGSLPKYFDPEKYDVRVILPKYVCMKEQDKKKLHHEFHFYVNLGWRKQYVGILSAKNDGITYYFVDNEFYFAGDQPYHHIYEDVEKFAFFSKAVLEALPRLSYRPDILHCHDWQTALVPVYLEQLYKADPFYQHIKTVFTIHNLQFQGRFHLRAVSDITGLPESLFRPDKLEAYGEANYLKGGIVYADAVTTVSPTYAKDILTPEGGEGLDGVLRSHAYKLTGILNGIDNHVYDPATDPYIPCNYGENDLIAGKEVNKKALLQKMGLPYDPDCLVVGMVSRITEQKGYALVNYMMEELLSGGKIKLIVLGTGEERYENMLKHYEWRYPEVLKANITYSEELAHSIYAGADALLMPSQFEPCGLSQLMSMRYGTVPIVRETGGLKDTVIPYNEYKKTGTGFSFATYNAHDMRNVIYYAHQIYSSDKESWYGIMRRGMEQDFSWNHLARAYEKLYESL
ncbi:MAG: glycogen synthase GlgA [Roseburia sp.]